MNEKCIKMQNLYIELYLVLKYIKHDIVLLGSCFSAVFTISIVIGVLTLLYCKGVDIC